MTDFRFLRRWLKFQALSVLTMAATSSFAGLPAPDFAAPSDGVGYLPPDGATVTVNPPAIAWVPAPGASSFELEVSGDESFTSPVVRVAGNAYCLYTHTESMAPGRYFWRHRYETTATVENVSPWSRVRSFNVPADASLFPRPTREQISKAVPNGHPRMFMRPEDLPAIRAARDRVPREWGRILELADTALTAPLMAEPKPWTGGKWDSAEWLKYYGQIVASARHLESLSFAYLISGNRAYGEAAKSWLLNFAQWDPHGTSSVTVNDEQTMHIMFAGSRAYSWIYDLLNDAERAQIRNMLSERAADVYRRLHERPDPYEQYPYDSHNGRLWHFLGETALVLYGDVPEAATWLDYAMTIFWGWYPIWGDEDGGWAEGLHYYASYNELFLTWLEHARNVLKVEIQRKPFYAHAGDFPMYVTPPGATISGFGDFSNGTPSPTRVRVAAGYAAALANPEWQWFAETADAGTLVMPLQYMNASRAKPAARPPKPDSILKVFRRAGWAVFNTDMERPERNVQFMMRCSSFGNTSHSHSDQNGVVLAAYGSPLLVNTGFRDYYGSPFCKEWYWHTRSHNCIMLNGNGQERGFHAAGKLAAWGAEGSFGWAVGDATKAYGSRANLYRRWVANVRGEVIVLLDEVVTTAPSIQVLFHGKAPFGFPKSSGSFSLANGRAKLEGRLFGPGTVRLSQTDKYSIMPEDKKTTLPKEWHLTAEVQNPAPGQPVHIVTVLDVHERNGSPRAEDAKVAFDGGIPVVSWNFGEKRETLRFVIPELKVLLR
jgi:hypothetical protein